MLKNPSEKFVNRTQFLFPENLKFSGVGLYLLRNPGTSILFVTWWTYIYYKVYI